MKAVHLYLTGTQGSSFIGNVIFILFPEDDPEKNKLTLADPYHRRFLQLTRAEYKLYFVEEIEDEELLRKLMSCLGLN
jgi:hypothetical protein